VIQGSAALQFCLEDALQSKTLFLFMGYPRIGKPPGTYSTSQIAGPQVRKGLLPLMLAEVWLASGYLHQVGRFHKIEQ